jgi:TonB-dependent starch-binding outer membrane protein SusC
MMKYLLKKIRYLLILCLYFVHLTGAYAQVRNVNGTVTSDAGEGLPGVNIQIKGTSQGTISDINGQFSLSVPANAEALIFSFVGYMAQEVAIGNRTSFNVTLVTDLKSLEEIVVVGYGTQRKQDVTGSVASVNTSNIEKIATPDMARALQGQVAGVTVQTSGEPGTAPNVKIRGVGSFGFTGPLYIVDGVQTQHIQDISASEIESVTVLKDASAAAIYGTRAANGVVIITTKRGKKGPLKVSYDAYAGTQNIAKKIPVVGREQYQAINNLSVRNSPRFGAVNDPLTLAPGNDPNSPRFINNIDTDWQKESTKTGMITEHNVGLSGGGENSTINVAFNYFNQTGTVKGNGPNYERYSVRVNSEANRGRVRVGQSLNYSASNKDNLVVTRIDDPFSINYMVSMVNNAPTIPVYDPNRRGGFGGANSDVERGVLLNVVGWNSLPTRTSDRNRLLGNVFAEIDILENLKFKTNLNYDRTDWRDFGFDPMFDLGFFFQTNTARMYDTRGAGQNIQLNNTLDYKKIFSKHNVEALLGTEKIQDKFEQIITTANGFAEPYLYVIDAGQNKSAFGTKQEYSLGSFFGRFNYIYDDRYIVTGTLRRDASSRFGPANRWATFPAVAVGWKLHNEEFMKSFLPEQFSQIKFKGSYGVTGSQEIGNYSWQAFINGNAAYVFNNQLAPGFTQTRFANPNIVWESKVSTNVGLDLGMFNDKLLFTAEYFDNISRDILVGIRIPRSAGSFDNPIVNGASLRNKGFEFNLNYNNSVGDFQYSVGANFFTLKNEVLRLGEGNEPIYGAHSRTDVGGEIGAFYGWQMDGLFQTREEITNHAFQNAFTAPGDIRFKDLNGDGLINDLDRTYLGSAIPKIYYGTNLNASYKNFDMFMFFQGHAGNKVISGVYQSVNYAAGYENYHKDVLNHWTPENRNTLVPRPVIADPNNNGRTSERWLQDGSYIRLQNVQLGYTVPTNLFNKKAFDRARVYVSGQNVFTITGYKGFDPDFLNDGLFSRGFDGGSIPNPRTFMAGIQLSF